VVDGVNLLSVARRHHPALQLHGGSKDARVYGPLFSDEVEALNGLKICQALVDLVNERLIFHLHSWIADQLGARGEGDSLLLRQALEGRRGLTLLVSVPLLIEYEAVMTRAEHLKAAGLSVADVGVLLDAVAAVAEPVRLAFLWRPTLPDADDDMVLEAALSGDADMLVTFNRRDFEIATSAWGVLVVTPQEALKQMRKKDEKE